MDTRRAMMRLATLVCAIALTLGSSAWTMAQGDGTPGLRAFPDQDFVDGMNWPADKQVQLQIRGTLFTAWPENGSVKFDLGDFDLVRGDVLSMSNGDFSVDYTVKMLYVTGFDLGTQTVSGNVNIEREGEQVHVFVGQSPQRYLDAPMGSGIWYWTADFSDDPILSGGVCGNAEAWGLGAGSTIVDWCVPWFRVSQDWGYVEALNWPAGTAVSATVSHPDLPACSGPAASSDGLIAVIQLNPGCAVSSGDTVTVSGGGMTKEHVVTALDVTSFDVVGNRVGGVATPGPIVAIWVNGIDYSFMTTTPGGDGTWAVDLDDVGVDLVPGMSGRARQQDADGDRTVKDWVVPPAPPSPGSFTVFPDKEHLLGWNWPQGESIHLAIDDPASAATPDYAADATVGPAPWDENQILVYFPFAGLYDVKAGDLVTLSYDSVVASYTVEPMSLVGVYPDTDTIRGTAAAGATVYVWQHGQDLAMQTPQAAQDGSWLADFTTVGFDLQPGASGWAEVRGDGGNATALEWYVPNPRFTVFPEWEWMDGYDWPAGPVLVSVAGKPECSIPMVSDGAFFNGAFPGGCNVAVGDVVAFDQGPKHSEHQVQNLTVMSVDPGANTVQGTADTGAVVYVWPHETGQQVLVTADALGTWQVDFTGVYDIVPGSAGRSEIRDSFGNATAVDWGLPNPVFSAFPVDDAVEARFWPPGSQVHLSIDSQGKDGIADLEQDATIPQGDPFQVWVRLDFAGRYDLVAGDVVTVTDGVTPRTHTVRNLSIEEVDIGSDRVSGKADPGAVVNVWPHETGQQVQANADSGGAWTASVVPYDIRPGTGGRAEIRDEIGNGTAVDWYIPNPWFTVFPEGEVIEGWDWPLGAIMHMTIDDPAIDGAPDFSKDGEVTLDPWGSGQHWLWIELGGQYDLKPGDIVTLTDGVTERTHVVQDLSIAHARAENDSVAGTAAPYTDVSLWSWEDPEGRRLLTHADSAGDWEASFDEVGFDLLPGYHVRAEVWVDGNDTAVDRYVPNPHFNVFPEWDALELWEWPDGSVVQVTIDDPDTRKPQDFKGSYKINADEGDPSFHAWINLGDTYDVQPGDVITLKGKTGTRTHIVRHLAITLADAGSDTVAGTAEVGATVFIWPHGHDQYGLQLVAENGSWLAEFGQFGFELDPGTTGQAEIRDEAGNATAVEWSVHTPRIAAYLDQDFVIGWEWPHEAWVTLTIDDRTNGVGVDIQQYTQVVCAPFDPSCNTWWAMFDDLGGHDLKTGDVVVLTDGATTREHEVLPLTVNAVDGEADTVSGTSASEAWVYVYPWDAAFYPIQADADGNWVKNFTGLYDLVPGETNGIAEVFEDDGDSTAIDWFVREAPTRIWVGAFVADAGTWGLGEHSYRIAWQFTDPEPGGSGSGALTSFIVAGNAQEYPGFVLLRGGRLRAREGESCFKIEPIESETLPAVRPDQSTRFLFGWATDYLMTYAEAQAHFGSFEVWAHWDEGSSSAGSVQLGLDAASPTASDWPTYECSFTFTLPPGQ